MKSETIVLLAVVAGLGYVILSRSASPIQQPVPGSSRGGGGWSVGFNLGADALAGIAGGVSSLFDDAPSGGGGGGSPGMGGVLQGAGGALGGGSSNVVQQGSTSLIFG